MRRAARERVPSRSRPGRADGMRWSSLYCYPLPDGGLATQWRDITERKRAEEAAQYLARASDVLSSSLDYEQTLADLAHLVVPELADWCTVDIADGRRTRDRSRWRTPIRRRCGGRRSSAGDIRPIPMRRRVCPNVLRDGKAGAVLPRSPTRCSSPSAVDDEHLRIIREVGIRSAILVPLIAHERTLGVLTLIAAESGRRYDEADLALAHGARAPRGAGGGQRASASRRADGSRRRRARQSREERVPRRDEPRAAHAAQRDRRPRADPRDGAARSHHRLVSAKRSSASGERSDICSG